jgi:hypothetical protein
MVIVVVGVEVAEALVVAVFVVVVFEAQALWSN